MMELLTDPHAWIAFVTLSALEIVLGIDNIIFISILVSRLPPARRKAARITGLALAFLILVGVVLVADAFHFSVPKGYLYFAMAFSVGVEMVNIRLRRLMDERRNKKD